MTNTAMEHCPFFSIHMVGEHSKGGDFTELEQSKQLILRCLSRQWLLLPLQQHVQREARHFREPDQEERGRRKERQEEGSRAAAALVEGDHRHHLLLHCCHHLHRPQVLSPPCPCGVREGKGVYMCLLSG